MTTVGIPQRRVRTPAQPLWRGDTTRRALLFCGILSAIYYAAITALVATRWEGYSSASQVISELSAVGAPTRRLWLLVSWPYTLLALAFAWGVWTSAGRALRVAGAALLAFGALGVIGWPFAPMHLRETLAAGGGTLSDTMHMVLGGVTVALMLVVMAAAATAFGRQFRLYTVASVVVLFAFGFLVFLDAPEVAANRPTPLVGVWERINIGAFLLWEAVLAVALLRERAVAVSTAGRAAPTHEHAR